MSPARSARVPIFILWLLILPFFFSLYDASAGDHSLVVSKSTSLQLSPRMITPNSQYTKFHNSVKYERVKIHGLSRLKDLKKFAHLVKVKVEQTNSSIPASFVWVCFHGNESHGIGMCPPQTQWVKLTKGLWIQAMSPFDHKILDVRMVGSSAENIEVSIEEEFHRLRVVYLIIGIVMWSLAPSLGKSVFFFYSCAMASGIILVILMILFQGMRLLPTGRKNSLGLYLTASIAGLGSYLLHYLPGLFHSVFQNIGISNDMYYPIVLFLVILNLLIGAWLGFWVVRKHVLTVDGSIEMGISNFVASAVRLLGAIMIFQATVDKWLAIEALACGIVVSKFFRRVIGFKFLRQLRLSRNSKNTAHGRSRLPDSPSYEDSDEKCYDEFPNAGGSLLHGLRSKPFTLASCGSVQGLSQSPCATDTFLSSFHATSERRRFSKKEWEKFTRDSTKDALEDLISTPDFTSWASLNAERLTLRPQLNPPKPRWFGWF